MVQIIFKQVDGSEKAIDIQAGLSLMEGAVKQDIPNLEADCGGACACATCHVYIEDAFKDKLPEIQMAEEDMLDFAFDVKPNSRLSCQILVQDEHEGMVVHIPEKQF